MRNVHSCLSLHEKIYRGVMPMEMHFEEDFYREIIDSLNDGLYIVDKDRVIRFWNKAAERITGFAAWEVLGTPCSKDILMHVDEEGNDLCRGMCPLALAMATGKNRDAEVYLHHKKGHRVPVWVRAGVLRNSEGEVVGAVELFSDMTSIEANRLRLMELERLAMLDALTGLPNRRYMEHEIKTRIEERKRLKVPFGVLFMDIDHFKSFNDTHGHEVGDEVLKMLSNTLINNSRPFDVFGRWGGEEFLGVIRNVDQTELSKVAERIRVLVEKSFIVHEGKRLRATISIGATLFQDEDTMESVIKRADDLLYESKRSGRNRVTVG